MPNLELAGLRFTAQRISTGRLPTVAETVRWLGAVQAQDFPASLWAVGLRTSGAHIGDLHRAIEQAEIVRSWPMRGTLHFVAPEDLRWMLRLCTPRVIARTAAHDRQLGLDEATFSAAGRVLEAALMGRGTLTRPEAYQALEASGISAAGQRGIHILGRLSQNGLICFGPHQGKQPAFVLLDAWLPPGRSLVGEEAVAELALRYFTSHGPATAHDFAWWSNLTVTEAGQAVAALGSALDSLEVEGARYWLRRDSAATSSESSGIVLLPGFDEYILGYRDRSAVLAPEHARSVVPGNNGMFMATMASPTGEVLGTWRRTSRGGRLTVTPEPFQPLSPAQRASLAAESRRYADFLGEALRPNEE